MAHTQSSSASAELRRRLPDEDALLDRIRSGDERLFDQLVRRWSGLMLRLALVHVGSHAAAEDVVQEAWLTMLRDLDRFERRSSLRTWLLGIVVNLARSRARAERRATPVPEDTAGPIVASARFRPSSAARWPDHWLVGPAPWPVPEDALLAGEIRNVILDAVGALPPAQREVLVLRDFAGMDAAETCDVLGLTDVNQRVLLHRARSRVRNALERYFDATETT